MVNRREFLKASALGALGLTPAVKSLASRRQTSGYFTVHPFIENHPEAVFIMPTRIDNKMNSPAKRESGLAFGRSVFVPGDESGIPLVQSIPVKINLKTTGAGMFPLEDILGTVSDPCFVEGIFEGMKELGISAKQLHVRENPRGNSFEIYGLVDMFDRVGADFRNDFKGNLFKGMTEGKDYNWVEVPDGRWFKKLPQLEPINTPGTWLLNIAKFKAHGMGLTLCCKNLQGMLTNPFCTLCSPPDSDMKLPQYLQHGAIDFIRSEYERHAAERIIPRWDKPGKRGGIWQEVWSQRTLDNLSVTHCGLNIIEGIYGRDGDCGNNGPHPFEGKVEVDEKGRPKVVTAKDFLSNYIIFGKDIFRTDIIGHWLGGHEPGNFGFFHNAIERGMSDALDPRKIPIYLWEDGSATLIGLERLKRTPLLTYYLQKDYNGHNEPKYHMVDEPFDYSQVSGTSETVRPEKPDAFVLYQQSVDPSNPYASIEYRLPVSGFTRLEIRNARGEIIDVPVDGYRESGSHMALWNTGDAAPGSYTYRLRINAFETTGKVLLLG
jgi:hypothetical protein